MLKITLGEKAYTVEFVSALALREIEKPMEIIRRMDEQKQEPGAAFGRDLDILVQWFCLLFNRQFTPEDVYAHYPADRLVTDIAVALVAVQRRISAALSEFPMKPAAEDKKAQG